MRKCNKLLFSLFIGLVATGAYMNYFYEVKADIVESVLRLHVVAEDDTPAEQTLKLRVRDAVIAHLEGKLEGNETARESRRALSKELEAVADVAKNEISSRGFSHGVTVQLGRFDFPTKQYADTRLPAGNYHALRVQIGDGGGENWWCVLFPKLCFTSPAKAELPPESKEMLRRVLTQEEYALVADSLEAELPVQVKFRILELFGK